MSILATTTAAVNFALHNSPAACPIASAPFRVRPILKFLALPTWDRKTVARFDAFTTRFDAFELLAEAMDADAAEMMAESLEEQIRQFKTIDKLSLPTFHATPVAPPVVAKVKAARKAPRKTADIIAEAIDAARTAKNGYESEAIDGVLATLTPAQKTAVTRKLDEHRDGDRIVLFLLACALGCPVSFPEPTPAVEVETPAVEMQVEPTAYPFGQFDPSGSLWKAELRVIESTLRSEVADIIETHRDAFDVRETDAGPLAIAQLRYESMSTQEQQDFQDWIDAIGYIPGESDYGRLATDEAFEVFILECLEGCPIFPIYFPPTSPEGGDDEAESRDLPEDVCDGHGAVSHPGAGSLAPVARMGDRRDGIRSDRHVADVLEERGQVFDAPQGREADQAVSATGQGASGVPHGGRLNPAYAMSRFKGGFQLVPALSLAPLVVTFHGIGHPFHQADTTPTPSFRNAPVLRLSDPVLRLSDPETIEIMGTLYGVSRAPGGFDLCKAGGTCYRVTAGTPAPSCECRDWKYRREGLDSRGCKHLVALRSVGLIPAQHAADTPTVEMQPTTEEVHLMASMEELGIAPICGGSDEADESLTFDEWEGADDKFAIQIEGDAMIGDHIADGDFVIIQKQREWSDGQILAIPADDGSFILRRAFRVDGGSVNLEASNEAVPAITLETIEPLGVLVGVVRKY